MKKIGLNKTVKFFHVNFNTIDIDDILDIHKYLMKGKEYKIMFVII